MLHRDEINHDAKTVVAGATARKWSRKYLYGLCRATDHNTLAWFFANKRGRAFLRDLRAVKRQMTPKDKA
jgi:hypothetical protein